MKNAWEHSLRHWWDLLKLVWVTGEETKVFIESHCFLEELIKIESRLLCHQVTEGTFVKEEVDELCWTLCSKKNYRPDTHRVLSNQDGMRLWCLFNFLADGYPLTLVPEEVSWNTSKDLHHLWTLVGPSWSTWLVDLVANLGKAG